MSILARLGLAEGAQQTEQQHTQQATQQPAPQEQPKEVDPLEEASAWFKPAEGDHKVEQFDPAKLFSDVDPAKLQEEIKSIDFARGVITPELTEAIQAGGDGAVQAMSTMLNASSQRSVEAAMQIAASLVKRGLAESAPHVNRTVESTLRSTRMEEAIKEASPMFQQEATSFIVDKLKEVFNTKYPNATPAEWRDMAAKFATSISSVGSPIKEEATAPGSNDTDWDDFIKRVM